MFAPFDIYLFPINRIFQSDVRLLETNADLHGKSVFVFQFWYMDATHNYSHLSFIWLREELSSLGKYKENRSMKTDQIKSPFSLASMNQESIQTTCRFVHSRSAMSVEKVIFMWTVLSAFSPHMYCCNPIANDCLHPACPSELTAYHFFITYLNCVHTQPSFVLFNRPDTKVRKNPAVISAQIRSCLWLFARW